MGFNVIKTMQVVARLFVLALGGFASAAAISIEPRAGVGAQSPWISYIAAEETTNGEILSSRDNQQMACQAIARKAVVLNASGKYIEWTVKQRANTILVRCCLSGNNNANPTLSLWINNIFRQKVKLQSPRGEAILGSSPSTEKDPAYFDEARGFIQGDPLKPGDILSLRRDGDDADCVVDLVDLELVDAPPNEPQGYISITDCGAISDGKTDCTEAFVRCIAQAQKGERKVWIPPGIFLQTRQIVVDGITIRGAGPWYSILTSPLLRDKADNYRETCGFKLEGKKCEVRDLMIVGVTSERGKSGQHGVSGAPEDFTIDNVWIIHTQTGTWLSKGENGSIRNSRFRNTTADGLNLNSASHDIVVENNNSRGTGDDGLAVFSSSDHAGVLGPCHDIFVHNNTVEAPWNGNCIGVYGGNNIRVEDNLVRSSVRDAGVAVTTGFASWPGNRITVKKNDIVDCGGIHWKQEWGGMFIYTPGKDLTSLDVINNRIIDPTFSGIKIQGGSGTGCVNAKILDNEITSSGGVAILVTPSAKGTLSIATNAVNGGIVLLKNLAPATNVKLESDVQYP